MQTPLTIWVCFFFTSIPHVNSRIDGALPDIHMDIKDIVNDVLDLRIIFILHSVMSNDITTQIATHVTPDGI